MAKKTKIGFAGNDEFTERQWFQKGYLLNEGAQGNERYTNGTHQKTALYYTADDVHEGGEELKKMKKARAHEAYLRKKEKEEFQKEGWGRRENMHTEYQWLFEENRIPTSEANWCDGEELNKYWQMCSYGSNYYYCHRDFTRAPKDDDELAVARWRYKYRRSDPKANTYTAAEVLEIIQQMPEDRRSYYYEKL